MKKIKEKRAVHKSTHRDHLTIPIYWDSSSLKTLRLSNWLYSRFVISDELSLMIRMWKKFEKKKINKYKTYINRHNLLYMI